MTEVAIPASVMVSEFLYLYAVDLKSGRMYVNYQNVFL